MNPETIASLFNGHGAALYGSERVSQTEHALQCAMLAEQAGEPRELIVAALLHDLGHFLMAEHGSEDLRHQEVAAAALQECLDEAVIAPIRLHVAAKRYLCAVEADYWAGLSQGSKNSLVLQGGPYDAAAVATFRRAPHFEAAVRLRRYDDAAKCVGVVTPPLEHFLDIMATVLDRPRQ
jgi:phosphonate degradation associated HDIG domain protein